MSESLSKSLIALRRAEDVVVVRFLSPSMVEGDTIRLAAKQLEQVLGEARYFVLDFSKVLMLSSAMLGKLIEFNKSVKRLGGSWSLSGVSAPILEAFRILHLDKVFRIFPEESDALAALARSRVHVTTGV